MASIERHMEVSLASIKDRHPRLYETDLEKITAIMRELHEWLDEFAGKGEYTGRYYIRHRQERHHVEGVREITDILKRKHGYKYSDIIFEQAMLHIAIDFEDALEPVGVPCRADYRSIGFWKRIGAP